MKRLYLDCGSGISGDMAVAALLDLGADAAAVERAIASLGVPGLSVRISRVMKSGVSACDFEVILPEETGGLVVEEGRDLVSLITCTPYGVNTHRLVVTGERTEYTPQLQEEASSSPAVSSQWMKSYREAMVVGILIVVIIAAITWTVKRWHSRHCRHRRDYFG